MRAILSDACEVRAAYVFGPLPDGRVVSNVRAAIFSEPDESGQRFLAALAIGGTFEDAFRRLADQEGLDFDLLYARWIGETGGKWLAPVVRRNAPMEV